MMKMPKKIAAILMILIAAASLVVSLLVVIQLWRVQPILTEKVITSLTVVSDMVETTDQGLVLVAETLGNSSTSIDALADTTLTLAENISNTKSTISSFSPLFTDEIPLIIQNTQTTVASAQTSAAVIDSVLKGLASIPLIGIRYNPEESLGTTLGAVAESLMPLPESLKGIGSDLEATSTSLITLQTDIEGISANIEAISQNLEAAQEVIVQYQGQVDQLQSWLETGVNQAPSWVKIVVISLTFIIVWIMVAQAGMLMQGLNLFRSAK